MAAAPAAARMAARQLVRRETRRTSPTLTVRQLRRYHLALPLLKHPGLVMALVAHEHELLATQCDHSRIHQVRPDALGAQQLQHGDSPRPGGPVGQEQVARARVAQTVGGPGSTSFPA